MRRSSQTPEGAGSDIGDPIEVAVDVDDAQAVDRYQ